MPIAWDTLRYKPLSLAVPGAVLRYHAGTGTQKHSVPLTWASTCAWCTVDQTASPSPGMPHPAAVRASPNTAWQVHIHAPVAEHGGAARWASIQPRSWADMYALAAHMAKSPAQHNLLAGSGTSLPSITTQTNGTVLLCRCELPLALASTGPWVNDRVEWRVEMPGTPPQGLKGTWRSLRAAQDTAALPARVTSQHCTAVLTFEPSGALCMALVVAGWQGCDAGAVTHIRAAFWWQEQLCKLRAEASIPAPPAAQPAKVAVVDCTHQRCRVTWSTRCLLRHCLSLLCGAGQALELRLEHGHLLDTGSSAQRVQATPGWTLAGHLQDRETEAWHTVTGFSVDLVHAQTGEILQAKHMPVQWPEVLARRPDLFQCGFTVECVWGLEFTGLAPGTPLQARVAVQMPGCAGPATVAERAVATLQAPTIAPRQPALSEASSTSVALRTDHPAQPPLDSPYTAVQFCASPHSHDRAAPPGGSRAGFASPCSPIHAHGSYGVKATVPYEPGAATQLLQCLWPGSTYQVAARYRNAAGWGPWCQPLLVDTLGKPTLAPELLEAPQPAGLSSWPLSAHTVLLWHGRSADSALLSWKMPAAPPHDAPLTAIEVVARSPTHVAKFSTTVQGPLVSSRQRSLLPCHAASSPDGSTQWSALLQHLKPCCDYTVAIRGINEVGVGVGAVLPGVVRTLALASQPGPSPQLLRGIGLMTAHVPWPEPSSCVHGSARVAGGAIITGMDLQLRVTAPGADDATVAVSHLPLPADDARQQSSSTFPVQPGSAVQARTAWRSAAGAGPWSAWTPVVRALDVPRPAAEWPRARAAPGGVLLVPVLSNDRRLEWTLPACWQDGQAIAPPTRYHVTVQVLCDALQADGQGEQGWVRSHPYAGPDDAAYGILLPSTEVRVHDDLLHRAAARVAAVGVPASARWSWSVQASDCSGDQLSTCMPHDIPSGRVCIVELQAENACGIGPGAEATPEHMPLCITPRASPAGPPSPLPRTALDGSTPPLADLLTAILQRRTVPGLRQASVIPRALSADSSPTLRSADRAPLSPLVGTSKPPPSIPGIAPSWHLELRCVACRASLEAGCRFCCMCGTPVSLWPGLLRASDWSDTPDSAYVLILQPDQAAALTSQR